MSSNTNNTGANAGEGLGQAVKGVFNTAHGAGESLRGNINSFLDNAGEGLASQMGSKEEQEARQAKLDSTGASTTGTTTGTTGVGQNEGVAQKGAEEIKKGLGQLGSLGGNSGSTTRTSSTTGTGIDSTGTRQL